MTVIATDGKSMASDSRMCAGSAIISDQAQKLYRLDDGRIVGCTGPSTDNESLVAWLNAGSDMNAKPPIEVGEDGIEALILHPGGRILYINSRLLTVEWPAPATLGSGEAHATAILDWGGSPEDAVAAAIKRITSCGGPIISMSL